MSDRVRTPAGETPNPDWDGVMKTQARAPKERAPIKRAAYLAPESVREIVGNALQILTTQLQETRGDNDFDVLHAVARLLRQALQKLEQGAK